MKKYRNTIINILNIIVIIILIWSLQALDDSFQIAKRNLEHVELYRTLIRINMVVIGIAIEGKRLLKGLSTTLKVVWPSLVLSLSIVLLSLMPLLMDYVVKRLSGGFSIPNPIGSILFIIAYGKSWNVISLLIGIGIVRSITEVE